VNTQMSPLNRIKAPESLLASGAKHDNSQCFADFKGDTVRDGLQEQGGSCSCEDDKGA